MASGAHASISSSTASRASSLAWTSEMTATRGIGRWATVVVLSAAWLVGAFLLWRTSVPSGLDVGGLDVHRFFSARAIRRAADYQRFLDLLWLLHLAATIVALFVFLSGWLFQFGTHGVKSPRLRADVRALEQREGVPGTPVHVQDVSEVTTQANAFSSGFGPSANVILWNTILDPRFSPGEVR